MTGQPPSVWLATPKHNEQARVGGDQPWLHEVPADTQPQQHAAGNLHRGEVHWRSGSRPLFPIFCRGSVHLKSFLLCRIWSCIEQRPWSESALRPTTRLCWNKQEYKFWWDVDSSEILLSFHSAPSRFIYNSAAQLVGHGQEVYPAAA